MEKRLHAISLLLLMIVLVVSTLGVLGAVTAASDLALAERQAEYVGGIQDCTNQAHRWIASLESVTGENEAAEAEFTDGNGHMLYVRVVREAEGLRITAWKQYTVWEDRGIDNLYQKGE